ncbi:helix-turn-helix transcriptional regulator [Desulforhopalus sp. 52FAK]
METELVIPRFLASNTEMQSLHVDDVTCVEYRTSREARNIRILVTTYLFVVVLRGEKIIHLPDRDLHIRAGHAFFARRGSYLFSEILTSSDEYRTLVFCLDDSFLHRFLKRHAPLPTAVKAGPDEPIFRIHQTPLLLSSIQSLLPYFIHTSNNSGSLLKLKLEELLLLIIDEDSNQLFRSFLHQLHSIRKQNLLDIMEDYFRKPLKIEELAQLSGRSLSSFKRDFQNLFQESPRQWVTNRRLEEARALLLSSETNVSEACFAVGFENVSHFSQLFRKRYGRSPSTMKEEMGQAPLIALR